MIPNPDIWGAPETWCAPNYNDTGGPVCERINGKLPVFDSSLTGNAKFFLRTGVYNNQLTYGQPLDSSCCPWRIKGNSYWIAGVKQLSFAGSSNPVLTYAYKEDARALGCPLMISPLTSLDGKLYDPDYIWAPDYTQPGYQQPIVNQQTSPLLQFDYSKIVIVPSIRASATVGGSTTRYGLDEYINGGMTNKPYIQSLNFRVWTRNSNNIMIDSDGMLELHPWGATTAPADTSMPSLAAEYITYESFFDGDSYNVSGHGDSYVDIEASLIRSTAADTNDSIYSDEHQLLYIACPLDADITLDSNNDRVRASWQMQPEEIVQQYAMLGFWIWAGGDGTGNVAPDAWNPEHPDEHTIIPLFDEYGTTTGEYIRGADAIYAPAAAWTDDVFERDIYHGEPPYDPTEYDDNITELPDLSTSYIPTTAKLYPLQAGTVQTLIAYLNNVSANLSSDYDSTTKFLTNNPIDVICGLMYYPFDIVELYAGELSAASDIVLGNVQTDISALHLNKAIVEYDAGSVIYYPPDGLDDFRSYKPYSSAELYIPYCGSVDIDPTDYIGHNIGVKYLIDLQSGSCLALIYRDAMVLTSITGQIGVSVPLTGIQTATLQAAQQRADSAQKAAKMQAAGAAVSAVATAGALIAAVPTGGTSIAALAAIGTAGGLITGGMQGLDRHNDLQYQLEHQQTPYKTAGTASAVTSMANEQRCRLIIKRPVMLDNYQPDIYAHDTGYACCITAPLSSFSGYTKISNADLSGISCTSAERAALIAALQAGVYL